MAALVRQLCDRLDANVPAIVAEWQRLTNSPPWNQLTEAQWRDHLPEQLHALIEGALCDATSHAARELLVRTSTLHGEQRRSLGFDADTLLTEQYLLRNAIWKFLNADALSAEGVSGAVSEILRIDAAISVTTYGSLMGFHRAEVERARAWDEVLADLLDRWEHATPSDETRR